MTKRSNPFNNLSQYLLFSLMIALLGTSGCSLLSGEDPIFTELKGKKSGYVKSKLGLPHQREDSPSGAMVWTYLDNKKGTTAKTCSVSIAFRNDIVENVYMNRRNKSLVSYASSGCERIREDLRKKSD